MSRAARLLVLVATPPAVVVGFTVGFVLDRRLERLQRDLNGGAR